MLDNASDYRYIDVTGVDIRGRIVPTEDIDGLPLALRKEDHFFLYEAMLERLAVPSYFGNLFSSYDPTNSHYISFTSLQECLQKLRLPVDVIVFLKDTYDKGTHARLGWRIPTSSSYQMMTESQFETMKDGSLLKSSDLKWPASLDWADANWIGLYPKLWPSAPSADMMRALFYNVNRIGGKWSSPGLVRLPNSIYAPNVSVDYRISAAFSYSVEDVVNSSIAREEGELDVSSCLEGDNLSYQYTYSVDGQTRYTRTRTLNHNFSSGYNIVYHVRNVYSYEQLTSTWTEETHQSAEFRRLDALQFLFVFNPVFFNVERIHILARYKIQQGVPDAARVTTFANKSTTNGGTVIYRHGVLSPMDADNEPTYVATDDSGNIGRRFAIPALSAAEYRSMIRLAVPSETFSSSNSWDYQIILDGIWTFDERDFRTTLPSEWTWTP